VPRRPRNACFPFPPTSSPPHRWKFEIRTKYCLMPLLSREPSVSAFDLDDFFCFQQPVNFCRCSLFFSSAASLLVVPMGPWFSPFAIRLQRNLVSPSTRLPSPFPREQKFALPSRFFEPTRTLFGNNVPFYLCCFPPWMYAPTLSFNFPPPPHFDSLSSQPPQFLSRRLGPPCPFFRFWLFACFFPPGRVKINPPTRLPPRFFGSLFNP